MAVTLTSKESHQISFPGGTQHSRPVLPPVNLTVTVETGVVVFTLLGTNPHDWTRDTLSFAVGPAAPEAEFVSGIAAAAPASFWTPMNNVATAGGGAETVFVSGSDSNNDQFSGSGIVQLPPVPIPPPVGFAIDSAEISHGQSGQPRLTLALAVFGNCAAMLRASYTAYIITRPGTGVVVEVPIRDLAGLSPTGGPSVRTHVAQGGYGYEHGVRFCAAVAFWGRFRPPV